MATTLNTSWTARIGQVSQHREQSPSASRHLHATVAGQLKIQVSGQEHRWGREAEKLQRGLLLISDLCQAETSHSPPQNTIVSGALEQFKRGTVGLVVMGEVHTEKHPGSRGRRGDLRPRVDWSAVSGWTWVQTPVQGSQGRACRPNSLLSKLHLGSNEDDPGCRF